MMLCPATHCGQMMETDVRAGYDPDSGLECLFVPAAVIVA